MIAESKIENPKSKIERRADKVIKMKYRQRQGQGENMKKKITGFALSAMLLTLCVPAAAQQPGRVYRIGYLQISSREQQLYLVRAFEEGMRDLGYVKGKNLVVEYRFADGKLERLPELAADLVRLKVDVIVTGVNPNTIAAKQATTTIPIVMAAGNDPVGAGLVASLARPGGNITGLTVDAGDELPGKRLDLLKEAVPKLSRVAVLWNTANSAHSHYLKAIEEPAKGLKLTLIPVGFREAGDFESAFRKAVRERANGLIVFSDGVTLGQRGPIADLAIKNRLPAISGAAQYAEAGGLISYGADQAERFRRAAAYVDKILKGTKPADLPVEQPTKFKLVINLKTAKQIGLTIPPNVLVRADRVIK